MLWQWLHIDSDSAYYFGVLQCYCLKYGAKEYSDHWPVEGREKLEPGLNDFGERLCHVDHDKTVETKNQTPEYGNKETHQYCHCVVQKHLKIDRKVRKQ